MTTLAVAAWMLRSVALATAALAVQRAWPTQRGRISIIAFAALLGLTGHAFLGGPHLDVDGLAISAALLAERAPTGSGEDWLLHLYLLGGGLFLVREVLGATRLQALLRESRPFADEAWQLSLRLCADQLRLPRPPELRVCARLSPAATGLRRRVVLLPPGCEEWSEEQRRFVLLHELAHFCHGDLLARMAVRAVCVVQWFNPIAWLLARSMDLDREAACDSRVAEETQQRAAYAEILLELAQTLPTAWEHPLASTFGARRGSMLEERLRRLLAPVGPPPRWLRTAAGALLLAALVLCACSIQPTPKEDRVWTQDEVRQRLQADPFPESAS